MTIGKVLVRSRRGHRLRPSAQVFYGRHIRASCRRALIYLNIVLEINTDR